MSANQIIAQKAAKEAINQLSQDELFISARMIDWRESNGYCEPKIRLENEYGKFEGWVSDGQSVDDVQWEEV